MRLAKYEIGSGAKRLREESRQALAEGDREKAGELLTAAIFLDKRLARAMKRLEN